MVVLIITLCYFWVWLNAREQILFVIWQVTTLLPHAWMLWIYIQLQAYIISAEKANFHEALHFHRRLPFSMKNMPTFPLKIFILTTRRSLTFMRRCMWHNYFDDARISKAYACDSVQRSAPYRSNEFFENTFRFPESFSSNQGWDACPFTWATMSKKLPVGRKREAWKLKSGCGTRGWSVETGFTILIYSWCIWQTGYLVG